MTQYIFGQNSLANKAAKIISNYKESDSIQKSLENDIEKSSKGAGSRGGKVIGQTKSGKPIYDKFSHPSHKDFTKQDHMDASNIHPMKSVEGNMHGHKGQMLRAREKREEEKIESKEKHKYVAEASVGQHLIQTEYGVIQLSGDEVTEIYGSVNKLKEREDKNKEVKNKYSGKNDSYLGKHPDGDHWVKHSSGTTSRYSSNEMDEVYGKNWSGSDAIKKSEDTDLSKALETLGWNNDFADIEKSGEGSKGGKVIGHTKSGKPIYENASHASHKDFSVADHNDAIDKHEEVRDKYHKNNQSTDKDKADNDNAYEQQKHHIGQKNALLREKEGDDVKKSDEEEIFDAAQIELENAYEIIKSLDTSKLIRKQVQVKDKSGNVHYAIRYVSPETGKSHVTGKESGTHDHFGDDDVAKLEAIINSDSSKSQKIRDLIGMGVYDKKAIILFTQSAPAQVWNELDSLGISAKTLPKGESEKKVSETGEDMPESDDNGGFPPDDLSDLSKGKLKKVMDAQRVKMRAENGLSYKDFWNSYDRTLKGVILDGYPKSLIAYGTGGLGKTYNFDKMAEKLQVRMYDQEIDPSPDQYDAVTIKGGTGVRDMWSIVVKNKDKLIVFDDCDSMWDDSQEAAQNILKGMLDTTGDGSVRYGQAGKDENGMQLPKQIKFTGQVVFISNLPRTAFPQPLISSRCGAIDLTMTKDETMEKLNDIKDLIQLKGKQDKVLDIPAKSRQAAYDFFKTHKNQLDVGQINARLFAQVAQVHKMMSTEGDMKGFEKEAMIRTNLV